MFIRIGNSASEQALRQRRTPEGEVPALPTGAAACFGIEGYSLRRRKTIWQNQTLHESQGSQRSRS